MMNFHDVVIHDGWELSEAASCFLTSGSLRNILFMFCTQTHCTPCLSELNFGEL